METIENSNNRPGESWSAVLGNSSPSPDIIVHNEEHKREAICKACGVIWHPYKTDTRRPTRCPYCRSRKTEWVDMHPELLTLQNKQMKADDADVEMLDTSVKTDEAEWNAVGLSYEETMENSGLPQDETYGYVDDAEEEDEDEPNSDDSRSQDIPPVYARATPGHSKGTAAVYHVKKKAAGFPKAAVYLILGAMLIYGLVRIWNAMRKPVQKKETDSKPAEAAFTTENVTPPFMTETRHMGLAEMALREKHLF